MTSREIFVDSPQVAVYDGKGNRKTFDSLYQSERRTIELALPDVETVNDIGCLNGDLYAVIKERKSISYTGIDFDPDALEVARRQYPDATFLDGDFFDPEFSAPPADLAIALNVFDHFEDWRSAMRNLARFSRRYINFSTLLRLDGGPSLVDPDLSFLYYGGADKRLLWAVHNVWWLAAYAATEDVGACNIHVDCYKKYAERFNNIVHADKSVHALPIDDLYVGNVLIEIGEPMLNSKRRPALKIVADDTTVFDSPWAVGA